MTCLGTEKIFEGGHKILSRNLRTQESKNSVDYLLNMTETAYIGDYLTDVYDTTHYHHLLFAYS